MNTLYAILAMTLTPQGAVDNVSWSKTTYDTREAAIAAGTEVLSENSARVFEITKTVMPTPEWEFAPDGTAFAKGVGIRVLVMQFEHQGNDIPQ